MRGERIEKEEANARETVREQKTWTCMTCQVKFNLKSSFPHSPGSEKQNAKGRRLPVHVERLGGSKLTKRKTFKDDVEYTYCIPAGVKNAPWARGLTLYTSKRVSSRRFWISRTRTLSVCCLCLAAVKSP